MLLDQSSVEINLFEIPKTICKKIVKKIKI